MAATVTLVTDQGRVVCRRCTLAQSPFRRLRGLLGRSGLDPDEGLLLRPAGSVHTLFMRFPIDVVFLDRELAVVGAVSRLRPWRAAGRRAARVVLELPAGTIERAGLVAGDRLTMLPAAQES
jgi:uncharacterized membrane protein (UPF0127 family)